MVVLKYLSATVRGWYKITLFVNSLQIYVEDVNDHAPTMTLSPAKIQIYENSPVDKFVGKMVTEAPQPVLRHGFRQFVED